ncbi:hypothetical protein, partial [Mycobacterium sp.]
MVLLEGENADGVTVDEGSFDLSAGLSDDLPGELSDGDGPAALTAPDQVVAAILGTREGAAEAGYQLVSTGVTWSDQAQAAALRDALAARKLENVMLISAFLAAAALAQTVGSATGYSRTALLFIEPDTATLAVVDSADGAVSDVRREILPDDDDAAVATLAGLVSSAAGLPTRPDGVFVVGSGVDIPLIKPALDAATTLPLSAPEEPELALARGAALASAHAPLFASSTQALAYAQDPGTGLVDPYAVAPGYLAVPDVSVDGREALAYSAVPDEDDDGYTVAGADAGEDLASGMFPDFAPETVDAPGRTPFFTAMAVLTVFVVGVVALVLALAFGIRPHADQRPSLSSNVVASKPAPPPKAQVPAPPAPAPKPAPVPAAPAPVQAPA